MDQIFPRLFFIRCTLSFISIFFFAIMTDIDHKKEKCIRCRGHYTKESFIGKNGKTALSCINCRTSISNTNRIKAKENYEKEIKQRQNLAYTQDQLVDVLLNFMNSYEDFDSAEPCTQVLHIDISVFLNSFIDQRVNPIPTGFFKKVYLF